MVLLVVCTSWFRVAARGSGGVLVTCPSGRWPACAGEGTLRRLGAGRVVVRRRVGPVLDRSIGGVMVTGVMVARVSMERSTSTPTRLIRITTER